MRHAFAVLGWAAWLTVLAVALYVWTPDDTLPWGLLGAAATGAWLLGIALALARRRAEGLRFAPDFSFGTVVLVLGVASILNGLVFGLWLILTGAGLALVGVGGVVHELVAERRARPRAGVVP